MLGSMFVGRPPGNYDRLLDFSRAVTGSLFFVPSATFLDEVSPEGIAATASNEEAPVDVERLGADSSDPVRTNLSVSAGSLGIGSLNKKANHE